MKQLLVCLYGVVAYLAFLAVFLYLIGFVAGWGVPKAVDDGDPTSPLAAAALDTALVLSFGLVHSLMARAWCKRLWTKLVPAQAERSTYVLVASAQLALLCWQWRPLPALELWRTSGFALRALQLSGWAIAVSSTYLIDHFELFGLRQAFSGAAAPPVLRTPGLYRWVRHPLYLGMLVGLWVAPVMTASHFLLSALLTIYILIGVHHEERDLVRTFGDAYRRYQDAVPMLLPLTWRPWRAPAVPATGAHR